jgi:hypothetical protein
MAAIINAAKMAISSTMGASTAKAKNNPALTKAPRPHTNILTVPIAIPITARKYSGVILCSRSMIVHPTGNPPAAMQQPPPAKLVLII